MIFAITPADTPALLDLAREVEVFRPIEIQALDEVLHDYHASNQALGHRAVRSERDGLLLGFAYYAPAAMTDRTWYLWWIAVSKQRQGTGIGGELLRWAEDDIRSQQGRHLLIETSSLPHYELTRRFYLKHGYSVAAVLPDYYAEGDDMTVFRKRLLA